MHSWTYPALIHFQRESINFYIKEGDVQPPQLNTQSNRTRNPTFDDFFSCSHCISGQQLVHESSCESLQYFHFCDNWSHVMFLTQLYTNRGICLKYIPGLWYCHSTLSCVTWTPQDIQRWTESLQTHLRQHILVAGSIWNQVTVSSHSLMACDTQTNTKLAFSTSNSLYLM